MSEQLQFAFPSLDFPGRVTLMADEIAAKLGVTAKHVGDLIDENELMSIDLGGKGASRRCIRVPIESYRDFVMARMTGPRRRELLTNLPRATLRELVRELNEFLRSTDHAQK